MLKCYQRPQIATELKTTLEYSGMDFQFGWKPGKFRNTEGFIYKKKKKRQQTRKKKRTSVLSNAKAMFLLHEVTELCEPAAGVLFASSNTKEVKEDQIGRPTSFFY